MSARWRQLDELSIRATRLAAIVLNEISRIAEITRTRTFNFEMTDVKSKPLTKDVISGAIFMSKAWSHEMSEEGLIPLLVGNDLERISEDGTLGRIEHRETTAEYPDIAYLVLCFVKRDHIAPLAHHPTGFPHRDLFFKCLKPTEPWGDSIYHMLLKDLNIVLNLSEYYATTEPEYKPGLFANVPLLQSRAREHTGNGSCSEGTVRSISLQGEGPDDISELIVISDSSKVYFIAFKC